MAMLTIRRAWRHHRASRDRSLPWTYSNPSTRGSAPGDTIDPPVMGPPNGRPSDSSGVITEGGLEE